MAKRSVFVLPLAAALIGWALLGRPEAAPARAPTSRPIATASETPAPAPAADAPPPRPAAAAPALPAAAPATRNDAEPPEDPRVIAEEQTRVRASMAAAQARAARLEGRWSSDVREPAWADARESELHGRLERAGVAERFSEVACKESLCRLTLPGLGSDQLPAIHAVVGSGSEFVLAHDRIGLQPDPVGQRLLIYLAREGFAVPEIDQRSAPSPE